jgi:hypothetical protein
MTLLAILLFMLIVAVYCGSAGVRESTQALRIEIRNQTDELCREIRELRAALPHLDPELRQIVRLMENDKRRTELTEIRSALDDILSEVRDISNPPIREDYELMATDWNPGTHRGQPRG